MSRAEALKLRAYMLLGYGGITEIATRLGEHRPYVSGVLNGAITSAPMLDKVEGCLDAIEREREREAAA